MPARRGARSRCRRRGPGRCGGGEGALRGADQRGRTGAPGVCQVGSPLSSAPRPDGPSAASPQLRTGPHGSRVEEGHRKGQPAPGPSAATARLPCHQSCLLWENIPEQGHQLWNTSHQQGPDWSRTLGPSLLQSCRQQTLVLASPRGTCPRCPRACFEASEQRYCRGHPWGLTAAEAGSRGGLGLPVPPHSCPPPTPGRRTSLLPRPLLDTAQRTRGRGVLSRSQS